MYCLDKILSIEKYAVFFLLVIHTSAIPMSGTITHLWQYLPFRSHPWLK